MDECEGCKYFDKDEGYCTALICTPLSCDELLPCECGETDAVTLYAKGVNDEKNTDFDDFVDDFV